MNKKWMRCLFGSLGFSCCLALTGVAAAEEMAAADEAIKVKPTQAKPDESIKVKPTQAKPEVTPRAPIYSPSPYNCPKPAPYILPSTPSTEPGTTPRPHRAGRRHGPAPRWRRSR